MKTFNQLILEGTSNFRCGVTLPFQESKNTFSDIYGFYNMSIPSNSNVFWKSASGCLNKDKNKAILGAIGESLERYSASVYNLKIKKLTEIKGEKILLYEDFSLFSEKQYTDKNFKWKKPEKKDILLGEVYSIINNEKFWVPQELITLGVKKGKLFVPSTSNGLAAHTDKYKALLLATQELLERDALVTYWLNSLGGREITLDKKYIDSVNEKKGEIYCFDITQDWNPNPVILIYGYLNQRNKKRISMGVSCRENYDMAIEKAYSEWIQGCIFTGFYDIHNNGLDLSKISNVDDFDKHAIYYTLYPKLWDKVPLIKKKYKYKIDQNKNINYKNTFEVLDKLINKLHNSGIRIFYRDITTCDVKDSGITVLRVLSPDLSGIHSDEGAMFLGGKTSDVKWRYKKITEDQISFPNKYPHPLG